MYSTRPNSSQRVTEGVVSNCMHVALWTDQGAVGWHMGAGSGSSSLARHYHILLVRCINLPEPLV